MNGIARIAITIISQSRCLRSNFIITEQIVEAAVLSRKCLKNHNLKLLRAQVEKDENPKRRSAGAPQDASTQYARQMTLRFGVRQCSAAFDSHAADYNSFAVTTVSLSPESFPTPPPNVSP